MQLSQCVLVHRSWLVSSNLGRLVVLAGLSTSHHTEEALSTLHPLRDRQTRLPMWLHGPHRTGKVWSDALSMIRPRGVVRLHVAGPLDYRGGLPRQNSL
uniref:Uncharacterized protein n=1 Tax=Timema bartmani TaxID=61472 RepID=A0A7R9F3L1_9NEOP|nr:unnamed protein product [Timema bartmani]